MTRQDWIAESNRYAAGLLATRGKYNPEAAAAMGLNGYDTGVIDLKAERVKRLEGDLGKVAAELQQALNSATDPRVRQDIEILLKAARDQRITVGLRARLMLPYFDLPLTLFDGFRSLLDARNSRQRYPAALVRLKRYVGAEHGFEPITVLMRARMEPHLENPALTGPWAVELEQQLRNQRQYVSGIRELFSKSGLKGWQKDLATLSAQIDDYGNWVRLNILPRARNTYRLPPEMYADNLKQFGVDMDPHELIDRALFFFAQTRDEMQSLAARIAERHGWNSPDYRDVIGQLKKERIPNDSLVEVYRERLGEIEAIVNEHQLVSLPHRQVIIRLATPAESAAGAGPHFNAPRMIGNTGEVGEFVLPTSNPNAESKSEMNDFNYDAITWDITAHEARPGHELQWDRLLEHGVSTARAVFAYNSANGEGWALYSEALMKQYLPPEAQLCILQMRLMRAARAFLDPMLNLGLIEPAAAKRLLMEQVGLSEPTAKKEIDSYTFVSPGSATSYFYGYMKFAALRTQTEIALGDRFALQPYHDFVVGQGLLPLDLIEKAVREDFMPSRQRL